MLNLRVISRKYRCLLIYSALMLAGCGKSVQTSTLVYDNDFETQDYSGISRANISKIKDNLVLGPFNDGGFTLSLKDLPPHDFVEVSFDLHTLDSWDGNAAGSSGPDLWEIRANGVLDFQTTFRFRYCQGLDCVSQSYPGPYPSTNYPRTGALPDSIKGGCILFGEPDGTCIYPIRRMIRHSGETFVLDIDDHLKELGVPQSQRICDESWAVDKMRIKVVSVN